MLAQISDRFNHWEERWSKGHKNVAKALQENPIASIVYGLLGGTGGCLVNLVTGVSNVGCFSTAMVAFQIAPISIALADAIGPRLKDKDWTLIKKDSPEILQLTGKLLKIAIPVLVIQGICNNILGGQMSILEAFTKGYVIPNLTARFLFEIEHRFKIGDKLDEVETRYKIADTINENVDAGYKACKAFKAKIF